MKIKKLIAVTAVIFEFATCSSERVHMVNGTVTEARVWYGRSLHCVLLDGLF